MPIMLKRLSQRISKLSTRCLAIASSTFSIVGGTNLVTSSANIGQLAAI